MHSLARSNLKSNVGQKCVIRGDSYTLAGKLGDGAVGVVRRIVRDKDERSFAIKFLAPDPKYIEESSFDDVAIRFKHEGERGCKLEHERLVKVLGYEENIEATCFGGNGPSHPFILMEYAAGRTLEAEIHKTPPEQAGKFSVDRDRLFVAIQIADALQYVHGKKLVPRDVKPANIFFTGRTKRSQLPRVKLGDFGIVKWRDFHQAMATGALTMTHQQGLGTLKYMSPEQAIRPKDVTAKSDMFSFGASLYELFTGQVLASPHHVFEVMNARMARGTTYARFLGLGHRIDASVDYLAGKLLDCFLRGTDGRPKASELLGTLAALYAKLFDEEWTEEFN